MKALYTQIKDIVTVQVYDIKINTYYKYHKETIKKKVYNKWYDKLLFRYKETEETHEGFHTSYDYDKLRTYLYSKEELEASDYIVENNQVYFKPRIDFKFSNKDGYSRTFTTVQEAEKFLEPIAYKIGTNLIRIV